MIDSPDIGPRKVNAKAGVQLAPLNPPNLANGRSSMMSINGGSEEGPGTNDSHPILRVQNYKKPQLEKLAYPSASMGMGLED